MSYCVQVYIAYEQAKLVYDKLYQMWQGGGLFLERQKALAEYERISTECAALTRMVQELAQEE